MDSCRSGLQRPQIAYGNPPTELQQIISATRKCKVEGFEIRLPPRSATGSMMANQIAAFVSAWPDLRILNLFVTTAGRVLHAPTALSTLIHLAMRSMEFSKALKLAKRLQQLSLGIIPPDTTWPSTKFTPSPVYGQGHSVVQIERSINLPTVASMYREYCPTLVLFRCLVPLTWHHEGGREKIIVTYSSVRAKWCEEGGTGGWECVKETDGGTLFEPVFGMFE